MKRFCFNVLLIVVASIVFVSCQNKGSQQKKKRVHGIYSITKECEKDKLFDKYVSDLNQKSIPKIMETFKTSYPYEIWKIVSFYDEQENLNQHLSEKSFDEQDLVEQFNNVFSEEFIICLNKIDFKDLFIKGEFITQDFQVKEGEVCRIVSTFDKSKNQVSVVLSYDFFEDGEKYESSINYIYVLEGCTLKMKNLMLIN